MTGNIRGITFNNQLFYSADFAQFQNYFLSGYNGIIKGSVVSTASGKVTITPGFWMIQGRMLNVEDTVQLAAADFLSGVNQVVYEIDLTKTNTLTEFKQGELKILNTTTVRQDDLNDGGTVYQWKIAHFNYSGGSISSFVVDAPTLVLDNIYSQVSANFDVIKAQADGIIDGAEQYVLTAEGAFDTFLAGKTATINALVAALEAEGFEKKAIYSTMTMTAAGWTGTTYSFQSSFPFASFDIEIQPAGTVTKAQLEAWNGALLVGDISANSVHAIGDVPTVDIPIIVKATAKY